jgi:hypothetical protein
LDYLQVYKTNHKNNKQEGDLRDPFLLWKKDIEIPLYRHLISNWYLKSRTNYRFAYYITFIVQSSAFLKKIPLSFVSFYKTHPTQKQKIIVSGDFVLIVVKIERKKAL